MLTPLDAPTIAMIGTASVALTQILKDFGLQGEWNKVACLASAVVLGSVYLFLPDLWSALVLPLIGAVGTGGFSALQELAQKAGGSSPGL